MKINKEGENRDKTQFAKAVVALLRVENELFVIKRSDEMPIHKGEWGFIGGGLLAGENLEDGVKREFHEETSLSPDLIDEVRFYKSYQTFLGMKVYGFECQFKETKKKFLSELKSNGEWTDFAFLNPDMLKKKYFVRGLIRPQGDHVLFYDMHQFYPESLLWGLTAKFLYGMSS